MFDDTAALFHENVIAAYQQYIDARSTAASGRSQDLRLALNAAAALYHFREHLPQTLQRSRAQLAAQCSDYDLLADVVNASKHGELTYGTPRVRRASDIEEAIVLTEYTDAEGAYRDTEKIITVNLVDGSTRELGEILTHVLNFWLCELHTMNVLPKSRTFSLPAKRKPVPRAECVAPNLELVQGVRFKQRWQLMRYDNSTGTAAPVDLTGAKLEFEIYKPAELDLVLIHEKTGRSLSRKVPLGRDEMQALDQLANEAERQDYLASLPEARTALEELREEARSLDHEQADTTLQ